MPHGPMFQQSSFDPDTTRAPSAAFDDVCGAPPCGESLAYFGFDGSGDGRARA